jgi:uncharacterized protein (DUF58 family)
MFDALLGKLPPHPPRSPAVLPGLRFGAVAPSLLVVVPLLAFVLMFAGIIGSTTLTSPEARLARGPTQSASAQVVSVTDGAGCNQDSRTIAYAFTPPGAAEIRGRVTVCSGSPLWGVHPGETLAVKYLVADAHVNEVAGMPDNRPPFFLFLIFPFFFLFLFAPFYLPQLADFRRARLLVKTGTIARATVVFVRSRVPAVTWPGLQTANAFTVFVSFRTEDGRNVEAEARCGNAWLLQHLPPGAEVHIAYRPDRPRRAVLLEAYLR